MNRIIRAFSFNGPQKMAAGGMSAFGALAAIGRDPFSWPVFVVAVVLWPAICLVVNIVDPLKAYETEGESKEDGK